MTIHEILSRRSDLGTFLVHFTKGKTNHEAKESLISILKSERIEARSPMGIASKQVKGPNRDSQKCVCFTETPIEFSYLLTSDIEGRAVRLKPYGIAIPKLVGRKSGVNPIWYIDNTKGRYWLTEPLNKLVHMLARDPDLQNQEQLDLLLKITPFFETMGEGKDFSWEREWRHVGNFDLPNRFIVFCPEEDFREFETITSRKEEEFFRPYVVVLDPSWGLEQIIMKLVGYKESEWNPHL